MFGAGGGMASDSPTLITMKEYEDMAIRVEMRLE